MGRPRKVTAKVEEHILGVLAMGGDYRIAADEIGLSISAVKMHIMRHEGFRERVLEARARADENVIKSLYTTAMSGNVTAMIFWLKNRQPALWRDRHEYTAQIDHSTVYTVEIEGVGEVETYTPGLSDPRPN